MAFCSIFRITNENIIKNKQKILDSLNQEMNEILFKNINIIPNDRKIKK